MGDAVVGELDAENEAESGGTGGTSVEKVNSAIFPGEETSIMLELVLRPAAIVVLLQSSFIASASKSRRLFLLVGRAAL